MFMLRRWRPIAAAALLAGAILAGCGQSSPPERPSGTGAAAPPATPGGSATQRLFAPNSVWNAPLANDAAIDPSSSAMIGWLDKQVTQEFAKGPAPNIEATTDSTPIYQVPRDQPTVRVTLENTASWGRTLAAALRSVPIPSGAMAATGSDAHLTIWQPSTDRLWELWEAHRTSSGWEAAWGGAIEHVSSSPGYYTPASWPGARTYWGSTATSLPVAAGTMLISELESGSIHHALAIALPAARANEYAWPAQRTDGTDTDPDSIPEGAHLRLDPNLDIASLHLPPVLQAIALAAQRYGLIVRDKSGQAVAFYAQAPTGGTDPYTRLFAGDPPYDMLKHFPWSDLEVLRMQLHHGTGSPA
jgi:hypothetical protein